MTKRFIPLVALVATLFCGCETQHYMTDAKHPEIAITADGGVTYRGQYVDPEDLPGLLRKSGLTKEDTINIHYPDDLQDFRLPRKVMGILSRNGYTRPILVGDRQSYSAAGRTSDERRREERLQRQQGQRKIIYK